MGELRYLPQGCGMISFDFEPIWKGRRGCVYPIVMQIARRTLSTASASLDVLNVMVVPSPLAKHTGRRWLMSSSLAPMNRELISNAGNARPEEIESADM